MTLGEVRAGMPEYDVRHVDHLFIATAAEYRQPPGMPPRILALTLEDLSEQYRAARRHAALYVKHAAACRKMFRDHADAVSDILVGASA